jgi:hypothetical protein
MGYSLGAVHGPLSGSGLLTIDKPIGLKLTVGSFPAGQSHTSGTPFQYFGAGRVTPGNADGWHRAISIRHDAQLVLPLAADFTKLGYDLVGAETLTVQELVAAVPPNTSLQPVDRGLLVWTQYAVASQGGGTASAVLWTYTVPAGRILAVERAAILGMRSAAATAAGIAQATVTVNGIPIADVANLGNTIGEVVRDSFEAGPLYLPAGNVISASASNPDTAGARLWWLFASGQTFNA